MKKPAKPPAYKPVNGLLRGLQVLRALLDECHGAARSVPEHLEAYGVSVDIVYELDQMRRRTLRIEMLLDALVSPAPLPELQRLVLHLLEVAARQRRLRPLLAQQYSRWCLRHGAPYLPRRIRRQVAEQPSANCWHPCCT